MNDNIDVKATGENLKYMITKAGYSAKDIQEYLKLTCVQSVYRWFSGISLPTVEHLYSISILLGTSMDDLIIDKYHRNEAVRTGLRTYYKGVYKLECYSRVLKKAL